jgi:hypothetical protein
MRQAIDQYVFDADINVSQIRDILSLTVLATQSVFGRCRTLTDTAFDLDVDGVCWIDVSSEVGEHLSQVFGGFVRREFGDRVRSLRSGPVPAIH